MRTSPLPFLCIAFAASPPASAASPDSLIHTLDTMRISAPAPADRQKIDIDATERRFGISDDLDAVLFQAPGVNRVPEAGSMLLVNGEGPQDNQFLLRGIPLFVPANFSGSTFADRSVVSLATPHDLRFHTRDFQGVYSGASGSVVALDPLFMPWFGPARRPQVAINYGTIGADLALLVPGFGATDQWQATYRPSDRYMMKIMDLTQFSSSNDAGVGYDIPQGYTDVQAIGETRLGPVIVEPLIWIGSDSYTNRYRKSAKGGFFPDSLVDFPWGVGILSLHSEWNRMPVNISVGAARQYHFEGQLVADVLPKKSLMRDNGALSADLTLFESNRSMLETRLFAEGARFTGTVTEDLGGDTVLSRRGTTGTVQSHWGLRLFGSRATWSFNGNVGLYYPGPAAFVDPGIVLTVPFRHSSLDVSAGITTAQPDVRGLPDNAMLGRLSHTAAFYVSGKANPFAWAELSAGAFVKGKDRTPVMSTRCELPAWDDTAAPPLVAAGVHGEADVRIGRHLRLSTAQAFQYSRLITGDPRRYYPWDVPWSNKTIFSFSPIESVLTVYGIGEFAAGMPYRDPVYRRGVLVWDTVPKRLPTYRRIDLKIEYRCRVERFIVSRFDVYGAVENIGYFISRYAGGTGEYWLNTREAFWTAADEPRRVGLRQYNLYLGLRVVFRLITPKDFREMR